MQVIRALVISPGFGHIISEYKGPVNGNMLNVKCMQTATMSCSLTKKDTLRCIDRAGLKQLT